MSKEPRALPQMDLRLSLWRRVSDPSGGVLAQETSRRPEG